jgi:CRP/FNR family transcriptional regulator, cyclic AMP receptor protein
MRLNHELALEPLRLAKETEKGLLEKLRSVPLFSGLKDKQLRSVLASGKQQEYPKDRVIVSEGEMGVAFYLVLDGAVEVRRKGRVLAKLGNGSFFGEMSLLDNSPRSSDVVAVGPTTCLVLSSWSFQACIESNVDIAMNLLKTLSQRLRESGTSMSD